MYITPMYTFITHTSAGVHVLYGHDSEYYIHCSTARVLHDSE